MADYLILDGQRIRVPFDTMTWEQHGLRFKPRRIKYNGTWYRSHNKPRTYEIQQIVHHWSGGEGSHRTIFWTLVQRKLGIHFYNTYDGVIYQYADPSELECAHAGSVNPWSIGIENQNRAWRHRDPSVEVRLDKHAPRGAFRDTIKGREVTMLGYSAAQLEAAEELTGVLCDFYGIAKQIPADPELLAQGAYASGITLRDNIPRDWNDKFEGVLGHYHVSKKLCPGVQMLERLLEYGEFEPVALIDE